MIRPVLVHKFYGDESPFDSLEELIGYVENELNEYRVIPIKIDELLNGEHYQYRVMWELI